MSTHKPIDPAYVEKMRAVAKVVDVFFNGQVMDKNRKVGFCMLVFPLGEAPRVGRINYISNGAREADIAVALRELADRFEGTHPEEQAG